MVGNSEAPSQSSCAPVQTCSAGAVGARPPSAGRRPVPGELRLRGAAGLTHALLWPSGDPHPVLGAQHGAPAAASLQRQQHRVTPPHTRTHTHGPVTLLINGNIA